MKPNVWRILLFRRTAQVTQTENVQGTFTQAIEPLQTMKHYCYHIILYIYLFEQKKKNSI